MSKKILLLLLIFSVSLHVSAQKKLTSKDSVSVFYNELFSILKKQYLLKNEVDWKSVEAETNQNLMEYDDFKTSLKEIAVLFDKIGATHCKVYFKNEEYGVKHVVDKESFSDQWKTKFAAKPGFEIQLLAGKFGYILMPPMKFDDISSGGIHKIAQPLYDKIADFKAQNKIEGWILDLRFNTGGNSWPMVLALYDFLGDNTIGGSLDINKKQDVTIKLANGKYLDNSKKVSYITPRGELLDKAKVAVITGSITASSGEVTALAFKGRQNTIFIGEKTFGMTTSNVKRVLPFNSMMALSTAYDCDRNGNFYGHIVPDVAVSKQDNFDDLLSDKNIQEAIEFISGS